MSSATVGLIKPQAPVVGVDNPMPMEPGMGMGMGIARKRKRKKMEADGMKPPVGKPVGKPIGKPAGKLKDPMVEMMGGKVPMKDKEMI